MRSQTSLNLCRALPLALAEGEVPQWLPLAPLGEILGRDGRRYRLDDAAPVIAALQSDGADIPVDWEHATHLKAPKGEPAPAAGWVKTLAVRDGQLMGEVEWNAAGIESLTSRAYRYYSPAYLVDERTRAVRGIASVGLTNKPNLHLPALNQEHAMTIPATILAALGLADTATEERALTALNQIKADRELALNRASTPDLSLWTPRADYDAALNRATQAETALRAAQQAELNRQIDALIDQGLQQARITPATIEYHRAQAQSEGGLERLKVYLSVAPQVLGGAAPPGRPPQGTPELNSQAAAIAAAFGNTPETLAKYGATR